MNYFMISLKICRNGMLKFATLSLSRSPRPFPGPMNEDGFFIFRNNYILAPYWARISQAGFARANNASTVYYHMYSRFSQLDKDVISRANYDVRRFQTNPSIPLFEAHWVLVVTWVRIYPPSYHRVKLVGFINLSRKFKNKKKPGLGVFQGIIRHSQ